MFTEKEQQEQKYDAALMKKYLPAIKLADSDYYMSGPLMELRLEISPAMIIGDIESKFRQDSDFRIPGKPMTTEEKICCATAWREYLVRFKAELDNSIYETERKLKKLDKEFRYVN